jgi:MerR family transcriptional regulator/heat shock protein HspR
VSSPLRSEEARVSFGFSREPGRGVYGISVAADLVGTGVQNLRAYERHGLLQPDRTEGGTRRYSEDDLARLRRIGELLGMGLNLAGIAYVLELEADNARLRDQIGQVRPSERQARSRRRSG